MSSHCNLYQQHMLSPSQVCTLCHLQSWRIPQMLDRSGAKSRGWPVTAVQGGQKPPEDAGQQQGGTLLSNSSWGCKKRCCWWQQVQVPGCHAAHPLCSFHRHQPFPGLHSPQYISEPASHPIPMLLCAWVAQQPALLLHPNAKGQTREKHRAAFPS